MFETYEQLLANIKSATKDLVAAFAEFVPAEDLVFQLDALRIEDAHPLLQVESPLAFYVRFHLSQKKHGAQSGDGMSVATQIPGYSSKLVPKWLVHTQEIQSKTTGCF